MILSITGNLQNSSQVRSCKQYLQIHGRTLHKASRVSTEVKALVLSGYEKDNFVILGSNNCVQDLIRMEKQPEKKPKKPSGRVENV